jgi:hydrogenase-1 operon protein HyaE
VTIELVSLAPANATPAIHPLIERLCAQTGAPVLDAATFDDWAGAPGRALVVFTEDPVMFRETLDLAVIVPELAKAFAADADRGFRVGVLLQAPARVIAKRYGFRRWPALVVLADGQYVGAIDGLREWQEYLEELGTLLVAPPGRAPTIGIAVTAAGADDGHHCH